MSLVCINSDPVTVEWMFFSFFLGFPVLVMCFALLSGTDYWWEITLLFWFSCVLSFFVIFCVHVVIYELKACFDVVKKYTNDDRENFFFILARCITLRQMATYSGLRKVNYLARGTIEDSEYTDKQSDKESKNLNMIPESYEEKISWLGKLTLWSRISSTDGNFCFRFYEHLDEGSEQRIYTLDDARDVRPYVTSYTWNLEKIFCRTRNSRYIAIIKGPGAITKSQMRSSVICSIIGTGLIFFFFFSVLLYLGLGIVFTMFLVAVAVIIALPTLKSTYRLYKLGVGLIRLKILTGFIARVEDREEVIESSENGDTPSEAVYVVEENYRVSRPTIFFCWIMFLLEVVIFFVYPFFSLFLVGNYPLALLFIIVAGISGVRFYINASIALEETGTMDLVGGGTEEEVWKKQSRLNHIVGNITRGRSRGAWMAVLGSLAFMTLGLFLGAVGTDVETMVTWDTPFVYTNDFEYKQENSLRYPTCTLTAGAANDGPLTTMAGTCSG
jgi:hypothetical protein